MSASENLDGQSHEFHQESDVEAFETPAMLKGVAAFAGSSGGLIAFKSLETGSHHFHETVANQLAGIALIGSGLGFGILTASLLSRGILRVRRHLRTNEASSLSAPVLRPQLPEDIDTPCTEDNIAKSAAPHLQNDSARN